MSLEIVWTLASLTFLSLPCCFFCFLFSRQYLAKCPLFLQWKQRLSAFNFSSCSGDNCCLAGLVVVAAVIAGVVPASLFLRLLFLDFGFVTPALVTSAFFFSLPSFVPEDPFALRALFSDSSLCSTYFPPRRRISTLTWWRGLLLSEIQP